VLSREIVVGPTPLYSGPAVIDLNFQPNAVTAAVRATVEIDFSSALDPATLTTANVRLRYSPDPDFFDANDSLINDADGAIVWDAVHHRAVFESAAALPVGHYLLELNGDEGGIADTRGRLLDGEFLDTAIAGADSIFLWPDSPSGDGAEGGDYRAFFAVAGPVNNLPTISDIADRSTDEDTATGAIAFTVVTWRRRRHR